MATVQPSASDELEDKKKNDETTKVFEKLADLEKQLEEAVKDTKSKKTSLEKAEHEYNEAHRVEYETYRQYTEYRLRVLSSQNRILADKLNAKVTTS